MTKKLYSPLLAALLLLGAATPRLAHAQPTSSAAQAAPLYIALGENSGIQLLTDDFVKRLKVDTRLASAFKNANDANLQRMLAQQFCKLSGGPCVYEGADMKSVHADMDITKTDFHALVEVLQMSMDARGIPFTAQNQLLALLAPMHRDVITVK
jgi:hemoglobin